MEIRTINCSVCCCPINPYDVTYHNAERTDAFCGAECSLKWYQSNVWKQDQSTQESKE